jgi:ribosomal protein S18 acetylase RimI-like enzyme
VRLTSACARGESDFVLNPMWQEEQELLGEFERNGIRAEEHLWVADAGDGRPLGLVGFLRRPGATLAGLVCPIVEREERGQGLGGELLRSALAQGERLGIRYVVAAIGVRNRAGYSLLSSQGFRPVRQHFLMRCDAASLRPQTGLDGFELELAKPGEAEPILELYAKCGFEQRSPEEMARLLADGRHTHAVARHDGEVVAFAELETHWPRRAWVAYVGVRPDLRDRGLGSRLVGWALARCFGAGAQDALLMLSPANRTAMRAYEKVGFRLFRVVDVLEKSL